MIGLLLLLAACGRGEPLTPGTPSPVVDKGGVAVLLNVQDRFQLADFRPGLGLRLIGPPLPEFEVHDSWAEARIAPREDRVVVTLAAQGSTEWGRTIYGPHADGWRVLASGDRASRVWVSDDLGLIHTVALHPTLDRSEHELRTFDGGVWRHRVTSPAHWTYPAALGPKTAWAALNTPDGFEIVHGPDEPVITWAPQPGGVTFFNARSLVVSLGRNEPVVWIDTEGQTIEHPDFDGTARSLSDDGGQIADGRVRSIVGREILDFGEATTGLRPTDVLPIAGRRVLLRMGAQVELRSSEGHRRLFTAPAQNQPPPPGYGATEPQVRAMIWVPEQELAVLSVGYVARAGQRSKDVAFAFFAWRPATGEVQRLREWASPVIGIGPFAANEAGIYWQDGDKLWFTDHEYAQPRPIELPGPLITFLGSRSP